MITVNNKRLCENCFMETETEPCPYCSFDKDNGKRDITVLEMGSVLDGRYMTGGVIGKGGFGITYLAYDIKLEKRIAVKEYYPRGIASRGEDRSTVSASDENSEKTFKDGAERFYREAELVSQFNGNPNIVNVHDFFRENDTVYFTMGYLKGATLKTYINTKGHITEGQAMSVYKCVTNALLITHSMNILHRDISPDNIMLCDDGTIKLIDFGAARQVIAEESHSLSVILKQGFAPLEQYQKKGKQGPWTDIYALGSTIYTALTGDYLDDPMSRMEDDSEFEGNKYGISEGLWNIIRKSTMLQIKDRYQDIIELKKDLTSLKIEEEPFTDTGLMSRTDLNTHSGDKTEIISNVFSSDPAETVLLRDENEGSDNKTVLIRGENISDSQAAVYESKVQEKKRGSGKGYNTGTRRKPGRTKQPVMIIAAAGILTAAAAIMAVWQLRYGQAERQTEENSVMQVEEASGENIQMTTEMEENEKHTEPVDGKCGENAQWSFEDGILTISGTGDMDSYNGLDLGSRQPPWGDFRNDISRVIIENGITSIGAYAFARSSNLMDVEIPSSVQKIGIYAFQDCENLKEVTLPDGVDYKSNFAFQGCDTKITYPDISE